MLKSECVAIPSMEHCRTCSCYVLHHHSDACKPCCNAFTEEEMLEHSSVLEQLTLRDLFALALSTSVMGRGDVNARDIWNSADELVRLRDEHEKENGK